MPGGPKLRAPDVQHRPGPEVQVIEDIVFDGNKAFTDEQAARPDEGQQADGLAVVHHRRRQVPGSRSSRTTRSKVSEFYQNNGYAQARVGQPQVEAITTPRTARRAGSACASRSMKASATRSASSTIADEQGAQARGAPARCSRSTKATSTATRRSRRASRRPRRSTAPTASGSSRPTPDSASAGIDPRRPGSRSARARRRPSSTSRCRMDEGKQFFVNRITFIGNTTTHDNVIRREMRVARRRRLQHRGAQGERPAAEPARLLQAARGQGRRDRASRRRPGTDGKVDIKLKFEEQNRNQLAFGAGVSQFDGFFGQLSFQTVELPGPRRDRRRLAAEGHRRRGNYQVSFSEPYLFDRPITAGVDVFTRQYIFPLAVHAAVERGTNTVARLPAGGLHAAVPRLQLRARPGVRHQRRSTSARRCSRRARTCATRCCSIRAASARSARSRRASSSTRSTSRSSRLRARATRRRFDVAGIGGNTDYVQTRLEGIWYHPLSRNRTSARVARRRRSTSGRTASTTTLPIFEKFFMGGEYSVRGFDIRTIGPRDPISGLVTGGNKTLIFNAEYYINIAAPVRLLGVLRRRPGAGRRRSRSAGRSR